MAKKKNLKPKINMNDFEFGDKLKLSTGEMGIYAGWYYPFIENPNNEDLEYNPSKDKLHNVIVKHKTYFGVMQVYDYGRLHGDISVVGRWKEEENTRPNSYAKDKNIVCGKDDKKETNGKKIYVSLPISGYDLQERKGYAGKVKAELMGKHPGCEVVTPFDVCPDSTLPYNELMGRDIAALLDCDAVFFCNGWHKSKGCMAEHELAKVYGKEIMF